ncbi:MAG: transcription termination factor NusA [Anaerolineaceae bacterium]
MKNEFTLAFNEVLEEKQLPKEVILNALQSAMVSAYRRAVNASNNQHVEATVDIETGKVTVFAEKEVVEDVQDERTEVLLEEAQKYNPDAELGMLVVVESTPSDFGRVAAQTARQVIQQRIRDAERQAQLDYYDKQVGEIISGVVQAVSAQGLTIGLEMKAEGLMPRKELIPGERFRIHDRVRALVAETKDSNRGPQIILSRTHRNFLRRLLETEVPEIYHGIVEIRSIAREPGERAKVAVSATQQGVDPVGACVGIRGVRIQAIVRELHDEKIDVIEWSADPAVFIQKAISPARVTGVYLNERSSGGKTATVVVPEDQLSLAIGRDGQNARLAAKLTSWRIDIKSLPEAAADVLYRLQNDETLAEAAKNEKDKIPAIEELLAKKTEGRSLSLEDLEKIAQFVDRVEKRTSVRQMQELKNEEEAMLAELRKTIPERAFNTNILDSGLQEHVTYLLQEAGYSTVGELAIQMKRQPDDILRLNGIGPKAMQEIVTLIENLAELFAEPVTSVETSELEAVPFETLMDNVEDLNPEVEVLATENETELEVEVSTEPAQSEEIVQPEDKAEVEAPKDEVEEEELSFDELFALKASEIKAENFILDDSETDESEEDITNKDKKKGKKKRSHVTVEYDPDRDMTIAKKKHKRGSGDGWDWEL